MNAIVTIVIKAEHIAFVSHAETATPTIRSVKSSPEFHHHRLRPYEFGQNNESNSKEEEDFCESLFGEHFDKRKEDCVNNTTILVLFNFNFPLGIT